MLFTFFFVTRYLRNQQCLADVTCKFNYVPHITYWAVIFCIFFSHYMRKQLLKPLEELNKRGESYINKILHSVKRKKKELFSIDSFFPRTFFDMSRHHHHALHSRWGGEAMYSVTGWWHAVRGRRRAAVGLREPEERLTVWRISGSSEWDPGENQGHSWQ